MTIRSRQPLLYFLLLILLLQWSTNKKSDGAAIYLRGSNYVDPFYHDLNYYDALANLEYDADPSDAEGTLKQQTPIDDVQLDLDEGDSAQSVDSDLREPETMDHEERGDNERIDGLILMDNDNAANRKRNTIESTQQEQKASLTCHAQTPQQQACLDAAVKNTKDTIEHVTTLIKRMREHAVSIVKDVNELEGDFLGACQDDRPKNICSNKPPVSKGKCKASYGIGIGDELGGAGGGGSMEDGAGGFKRIYIDQENNQNSNNNNNYGNSDNENNNEYNNNQNKVSYGNNYQYSNDNRNSNENPYNSDGLNGGQRGDNNNSNNNNGGNEGGSSNPNVNTNTNSNPNSKGAPTKPRILMNEFAMPIQTDSSDMSHSDIVEQAQYAVNAWKNQIEECKRVLDDAMYHAVQQHQAAINAEKNPTMQHVVNPIKSPDEAAGLRPVYAAPPAAASITPVHSRNAKDNNNNKNIDNVNHNNIITSDIASSLSQDKDSDAATLKGIDDKFTEDKLAFPVVEGSKEVRGDNNNDADSDINDSTNNKRNEDAKKCRSDTAKKKNRDVAPLLSVFSRMGF